MWREYCVAHEAAQFEKKPLTFYAELDLIFSGSTAIGIYSSASTTRTASFRNNEEQEETEEEDDWSLPPIEPSPDEAVSFEAVRGIMQCFGVGGDNLGAVPMSMAELDSGICYLFEIFSI